MKLLLPSFPGTVDMIQLKPFSIYIVFRTWYRTDYKTQYDVSYTAATRPAKPVEVREQRLAEIHSVTLAWTIEGCAEVSLQIN